MKILRGVILLILMAACVQAGEITTLYGDTTSTYTGSTSLEYTLQGFTFSPDNECTADSIGAWVYCGATDFAVRGYIYVKRGDYYQQIDNYVDSFYFSPSADTQCYLKLENNVTLQSDSIYWVSILTSSLTGSAYLRITGEGQEVVGDTVWSSVVLSKFGPDSVAVSSVSALNGNSGAIWLWTHTNVPRRGTWVKNFRVMGRVR